jgi:hypothetical protein
MPYEGWVRDRFSVVYGSNASNEIKLFAIMDLLHEGAISLHKAHNMCEDVGLFSTGWCAIDFEMSKAIGEVYEEKGETWDVFFELEQQAFAKLKKCNSVKTANQFAEPE